MPDPPRLTDIRTALKAFAFETQIRAAAHIKPLHWYTACRLVIEGGIHPDHIMPRPPIHLEERGNHRILHHDPSSAIAGERTVLGGLKTKQVDVTVSLPGVGPAIAVSLKGAQNAPRNLTNRMEKAGGDCTNLHLAYPALVYGYWCVLRANAEDDPAPVAPFKLEAGRYKRSDLTVMSDGRLSEIVLRFAHALNRLSERRDLRDEPSRYEACGLTLVKVEGGPTRLGIYSGYPGQDPLLDYNRLFSRLYEIYDQRFVYEAPGLKSVTDRLTWEATSPLLVDSVTAGTAFDEMRPRVAA